MYRIVNLEIINAWLDKHQPNAVPKLVIASKLSLTTISSVRTGLVPGREVTRDALARALGVQTEDLFPFNKRGARAHHP